MTGPVEAVPVAVPTVRYFVPGNSGSGKSTLAWHHLLRPFPRRLLLDMTGEHASVADAEADSVSEAVDAMRMLAKVRGSWTVTLALDPDELPELVDWLIPVPRLHRSPVVAWRGLVVLIDEVDLIAPQGSAPRHVRTLFRRSRHVGLSTVATTQRPANVSREVSAQSTHAVTLRLSEPRDVDYMVMLNRWGPRDVERWRAWTARHPHGATWQDLQAGRRLLVPDRGPWQEWKPEQAEFSPSLSEPAPA